MTSSLPGAYILPWTQTLVDGMAGAPVARIELGAPWRWTGEAIAVSVDTGRETQNTFEKAALATVRRMLGPNAARTVYPDVALETARSFHVSNGMRHFKVILIEIAEVARPLLLFPDGLPAADLDLRIVACSADRDTVNRMTEEPTGVICFTKGTEVATPDGPRLVEDLVEGDAVLTKDDGPQEVQWIGSRTMSGARLYAMPELRPVRLRAGAINGDCPQPDLVVSPRHRIVLKGDIARALFGTPEVLVQAKDLMDDRGILIDRTLKDVTYVHLLLPRHQIVWANGVETESFHPASTNLQTISDDQRARLLARAPGIEGDPHLYGGSARRPITSEEAAIFGAEVGCPR